MKFDIAHELKEALETENPEVVTPVYGLQNFAGQGLLAQCFSELQPQMRSETGTVFERHPSGSSTHEEPSESTCHRLDSRLKSHDGYLYSERSACAKILS